MPVMLNSLRMLICLLVMVYFVPVKYAIGDELKLTPSMTLKEEYNDNIFFTLNNRKSDFISILTPGVEFSGRSERLDANLQLKVNGILYGRTSDLSAVDQYYRGRLGYLLSPRTRISTDARYTVDSQPDREIDNTGLVTGAAVKRHKQQYSVSGERALTEKTAAALTYAYEQDDYDSNNFSDLEYHDASLTFTHDLERLLRATKGSLSLDYAHYKSSATLIDSLESDSIVDNYSASLGVNRAFNELWSLQASAGGRYTVSKFRSWEYALVQVSPLPIYLQELVPVSRKSREWGWVGQLGLTYKGELTTGNLSFSSDVQPSSGQTTGTTVRTGLVADLRRRFTYELSGSMSMGYYLNKSNPGATSGQEINQETILVTPGIRYQFNRDMYLEASYRFSKVFYNVSHTEADRNAFFVTFCIQRPFFM